MDGGDRLDAAPDFAIETELFKFQTDRFNKIVGVFFTVNTCFDEFTADKIVPVMIRKAHHQVFELLLDLIKPKPMGDRDVERLGFANNPALFFITVKAEMTHVVQAHGQADQRNADIFRESNDETDEILLVGKILGGIHPLNLSDPLNQLP